MIKYNTGPWREQGFKKKKMPQFIALYRKAPGEDQEV